MPFRGRGTVIISTAAPTASVDIGDAFVTGGAGLAADAQHQHAVPAPAAGYSTAVDSTAADGDATAPARANHVHQHTAAHHESGGHADLTGYFANGQVAVPIRLASELDDANGLKLVQVDAVNPADHHAFFELHGGTDPSGGLAEYGISVNNPLVSQTKMVLGVRGDCTSRTQEVTEAGSLITLAGHVEGALNAILELAPLATGGLPGINFFRMTSNVTGQAPILSAVGPDANVSMVLGVQNNGTFHFVRNLGLDANDDAFAIETIAAGVNHVVVTQAATGAGPNVHADGPDTNIDLNFNAKGAGHFYFAGGTVQCGGDTGGQAGTTGITNAIGVGDGAATNLQAPAHGTGSGPASLTVAQWLKVYVGAAAGWVPWCQ